MGKKTVTNLYKPKPGSTKSLVRSLYFIIACLAAYIIFGSSISNSNSEGQSVKDVDPEAALVKGLDLEAEVDEFKKKDDILLKRLKESHDELEAAKLKLAEAEKLSSPQLRGNGAEVKVEVPDTESRKRLAIVNKQVEHLKKEMQSRAKKEAEEKFGPGPHRIKFELDFNPEEMPEGDATSFTIEMAPLDLMPYTVNFFMSQVSLGLFNGCSFHRNAGHVVQGGPVPSHLNPGQKMHQGFKDAMLQSVGFQEYHPDFPHKKYTLGYAGRPGGPDFYVSTMDNTKNHGPGGQSSYEVESEADPCFAKVIEGFEAVDRMHALKTQPGGYKRLVHYVGIKSAVILDSKASDEE